MVKKKIKASKKPIKKIIVKGRKPSHKSKLSKVRKLIKLAKAKILKKKPKKKKR